MFEERTQNDNNEFNQGELDRATELWRNRNHAKKMKRKGNYLPGNSEEKVKLENKMKKYRKKKNKY